MFNKKAGFISGAAILVIILISIIYTFVNASKDFAISIYENIEEISLLDFEEDKGKYDKYLDDIVPNKSYVGDVKTEYGDFEIYAYEFYSIDDAKAYYGKARGSQPDEDHSWYFSGSLNSEGAVFNGKNVYRMRCKTGDLAEINNYLSTKFSIIMIDKDGNCLSPR